MKQNFPFLKHILDEINFLLKETETLTYEEFISNEVLKRSCTRSFEIIGEAVKNISDELKNKYKDIDWKKIAGMRDKIIHYYFGVNYNIVWQTIKDKLPTLKEKFEIIIKEVEENEN
jgi:uncharacterized protein with HEPN domain